MKRKPTQLHASDIKRDEYRELQKLSPIERLNATAELSPEPSASRIRMFPSELKELLFAFNSRNVKYLVIGAYAVIVHSHPPGTGNAKADYAGSANFAAPLGGLTLGVSSNRACFSHGHAASDGRYFARHQRC